IDKGADGKDVKHDIHQVSVGDLGLQPIDFVWMGSNSLDNTQGATELEIRIAYYYRRHHSIGDDKIVRIKFDPSVGIGDMTFARLFPLASHLRVLLSRNRSLNAEDFLPVAGGKANKNPVDKMNPRGYDASELRSRLESGLNSLLVLADAL